MKHNTVSYKYEKETCYHLFYVSNPVFNSLQNNTLLAAIPGIRSTCSQVLITL